MVDFDVSIWLIGVGVMLAGNDQDLLAPQPWHELVVQVFQAAGKAGWSLAGKKFIAINRKIEIMGGLAVKILYKSREDAASIKVVFRVVILSDNMNAGLLRLGERVDHSRVARAVVKDKDA